MNANRTAKSESCVSRRLPAIGLLLLMLTMSSRAATLQSLQRGSSTIANGQSQTTVTISTVDKSRSFLLFSLASAGNPSHYSVGGEITNSTTLTFKRHLTSDDVFIEWQVLQFSSGVSVQHGNFFRTGAARPGDTTIAIASVDQSKSFATVTISNYGGTHNGNEDATADIVRSDSLRIALATGPDSVTFFWQVVQFEGASVQKITPTMLGSELTATHTLSTAVDPARTMLVGNLRGTGAGGESGSWAPAEAPRAELTNGTTVSFTRGATGTSVDFVLYVVQFTDGTTVSRDTIQCANGIGSRTVSIGSVDVNRTAVVVPGHYGRQGSCDYNMGDDPGYGWFSVGLVGGNQVTATRIRTNSNAVCPYEVVTFASGATSNRTWVSNSSTDWFVASNWSPNGVPGSQDTVIVNGTGSANCILTGNVTIGGLRQSGGTINTSDGTSRNLTTHHFSLTNGSFVANNSVVTVSGDCYIDGSRNIFNHGTSTVKLTGSGTLYNPRADNAFDTLVLGAVGQTTTLLSNVDVESDVVFAGGTVTDGAEDYTIRNYPDGSTPICSVTAGSVMDFYKLQIWHENNGTVTIPSYHDYPYLVLRKMNWGTDVWLPADGGFTADTIQMRFGDPDHTNFDFDLNGQTVTCDHIQIGDDGGATDHGLLLNGGTLVVHGDLLLNHYTGATNSLDLSGGGTIRIGDDWTNEGATVISGTSTVIFDGGETTTQTITSGGGSFDNLTIQGTGQPVRLADALSVGGNMVISSGAFDLNGRNVNVSGDLTVNNGTSATFANLGGRTITVGGNAALNGQSGNLLNLNPSTGWTINAATSLGADYAAIANSNASAGVTGVATGTCTDGGGNTNWNFNLTAPTITQQPQPDTITEGESATFTVAATGNPAPSYQWRRRVGGSWQDISGATSSSYTVSNAALGDSGLYSVRVYNSVDTIISSSARLTVIQLCVAPQIQSTSADQNVQVGQNVTLSVTATGTEPGYQWYHDGLLMNGETSASLALSSVSTNDAGEYYAVVDNSCGTVTSRHIVVTICEPPSITAHPQNAELIAGGNTLFQVSATGTNLLYQWERDAGSGWQTVTGATSATHTVESATLSQNGHIYHCLVTNGCGQATSETCTLTVNAACVAVSITAHPQDTTVVEKSPATLRVAVSGTNPTFQWYRGSTPLPTGTTNPFTFTAFRRDNGVSYTCEVSGDCGTPVVSNPAVLSVQDTTRPHPTTTLTLNAPGPNDINVRWSTPETDSTDGDSVFVYYSSAGYRQPTSQEKNVLVADTVSTATGEREANLSGLTAETEYFFSVWLKDSVGNWAAADSGSVTTGSVGTPTNPVVVRGEYVSDTQVRLSLSNICPLVSAENPFTLYADYIGVWYQSGDYVLTPDTSDSNLLRFPVADLQADASCGGGGTQRDTVLSLPALSAPDSLYYFSVSVVWRNPDSVMAFTRANGDSVLMRDVSAPDNPCVVSGSYPGGRSDSAFVNVSNVGAIEPKVRDVVVYCSFDTTFADTFFVVTLPSDSVMSGAVADTFRVKVRNAAFDGSVRTVYCAVVLVSDGGVPSPVKRGAFPVGRELPQNPIELSALALSSYQVRLSWPSIAGVGADSICVYYDLEEIPVGAASVTTPFDPICLAPADTGVIVTDLTASTLYYFAAQAKIGLDWTAITTRSSAFATTLAPNPADSVRNTAVIDSTYFDTLTNSLGFIWHYDSLGDSIQYGIVYGIDSAAAAARQPAAWRDASEPFDTAKVQLGEGIVFDTAYYVFVRMRRIGGVTSPVSPAATRSIRTPTYTWQPISYFRSATGDTVWAFNRHVAMWYGNSWAFGTNIDTVRAVELQAAPVGLIPVSVAFTLSRYDDGPSVSLALRYDSIPTGCRPEDIRLYHLTPEGQWMVYHDYTFMSTRGMIVVDERLVLIDGQPLALMVDTRPPSVEVLTDIDIALAASTEQLDSLQVSDNVGNMVVSVLYARAENAPQVRVSDTLQGQSATIAVTVPAGYITDENGARVYVVVSDGLHVDTVNISRPVIREHASDISSPAGKWVPLRTTAVLDSPSVGMVIAGVLGQSGYDNTVCRVFRWFDPTSTDGVSRGNHQWVEYAASREALFPLEPGGLMWIKTLDDTRLDFGRGVTVSLRDTVSIALPPGEWSDIALPYSFGVCLGDILDATGADGDSLHYYRWGDGGNRRYVTDVMYIASMPDSSLHDRGAVLGAGATDGFSVYNPHEVSVSLRIPPTTSAMSAYHSISGALGKQRASDGWALKVLPSADSPTRFGTVVLGYAPVEGGGECSWYPEAPSFGGIRVRVVDKVRGRAYGHAVAHRFERGGVTFDLEITNDGAEAVSAGLRLSGMEMLADSLTVWLVDPSTGVISEAGEAMGVSVPAKGTVYRTVAVGGPGYFSAGFESVKPFAQFAAFPNPFRGAVMIRFMLPSEAHSVDYRLFDARGRMVWRYEQKNGIRTGMNTLVWDGAIGDGHRAATGMYMLRIRACDRHGRALATREQRLVHVR